MILELTEAQVATLRENSTPGRTLLCRIAPEAFDGTNATTSGRLRLEFGTVPTASLPALREAILKANHKPKKRTRKTNEQPKPKQRNLSHQSRAHNVKAP